MDARRSQQPLERFFSGLAEFTFQTKLGVADPPLIQYISQLLARFVSSDAIYKVRDPRGQRLQEVAAMLIEAEARIGAARREVHRHIGDFALFWTGVYPEALQRPQARNRVDFFLDYSEAGKRNYYLASTIEPANADSPDREVLERLSHEFDLCAYGLNEIRREWERRDPDDGETPRPLILE